MRRIRWPSSSSSAAGYRPSALIGAAGEGFKTAMRTLDIFRTSVAAAAPGFARRAFDEATAHARKRRMFGQTLADFQLTQAALADMATAIDAAALLTYRAAWLRDQGKPVTLEAAMAKMTATESAQAVIDRALQMFGGRGVERGAVVERLYREIRSLRIYEGATEVQKLIIGREVLQMTHKVLQPAGWARPKGYANGIAASGTQVFIAGQIGWNADQTFTSDARGAGAALPCTTSCACSRRRAGGPNTWCASPGS